MSKHHAQMSMIVTLNLVLGILTTNYVFGIIVLIVLKEHLILVIQVLIQIVMSATWTVFWIFVVTFNLILNVSIWVTMLVPKVIFKLKIIVNGLNNVTFAFLFLIWIVKICKLLFVIIETNVTKMVIHVVIKNNVLIIHKYLIVKMIRH